jgi:predicted ATPase
MKKYVLTGGPSSGKTSLILTLEQEHGKKVIRESAEDTIRLYEAKCVEEPWKHPHFIDQILELQIRREDQAQKAGFESVFIDKGILDGLAYYQIDGREPSEYMLRALEEMGKNPYDKVFLIENMGFCDTNNTRREDQESALKLQDLQYKNYQKYGYNPIIIKSGTLEERTKKILGGI